MRRILHALSIALVLSLGANAQSITKTTASGSTNSVFTVNGKVDVATTIFSNAADSMVNGDTLLIASKSDTIYVSEDNSDLVDVDIILMIVDSGVAHWTIRADWKLSDSTKLVMYNGGDLSSPLPCDANKKLVFGNYNVASCSGGNATYSFRDIMDFGGYDPINPPLPVSLTHFTAEEIDAQTVKLNWQTASEIHHERFELYKSVDGVNFNLIYTEYGNGVNSLETKDYFFVDQINSNKGAYYKLVQHDFDGQSETFNIVRVSPSKEATVSTFPNPATEFITVDIKSENNENNIELLNTSGQVLYSTTVGRNGSVKIDLNQFKTGLYILSVDGVNHKILKK
jgi:hypothetical protein